MLKTAGQIFCVLVWIAGFTLLGFAYSQSFETEKLRASWFPRPNGTPQRGFDKETGIDRPEVIASRDLSQKYAFTGVCTLLTGTLIGLLLSIRLPGHERRKRRRGSTSSKDHMARKIPRSRRHTV